MANSVRMGSPDCQESVTSPNSVALANICPSHVSSPGVEPDADTPEGVGVKSCSSVSVSN